MKRMIARLTRLGGLAALVLISHWAWAATPEVFYVHNDQLGTPRAVVDGNNVEVWRWEGDAYGEQPPEQDPSGTGQAFVFNLRYPGQYYDVETGRMYNGWRDYDPSTGRYVQSDPLGLEGGQWSTYAYVEGNPVQGVDPLGLWEVADVFPDQAPIVTIGRAMGGVAAYMAGMLSGDQMLASTALQGLSETRDKNTEVLVTLATMGRWRGAAQSEACPAATFPRGGPPRDPKTANYLPLPGAEGAHTTLGTRTGRNGSYTQGATFGEKGNFLGRTDVTNHGRGDHTNPHWHPALGPNSVGSAQPLPW